LTFIHTIISNIPRINHKELLKEGGSGGVAETMNGKEGAADVTGGNQMDWKGSRKFCRMSRGRIDKLGFNPLWTTVAWISKARRG
jgi:hypothetical protein